MCHKFQFNCHCFVKCLFSVNSTKSGKIAIIPKYIKPILLETIQFCISNYCFIMKAIVVFLFIAFAAFVSAAQNFTYRANGTNTFNHFNGTFPKGHQPINNQFGNRNFNSSVGFSGFHRTQPFNGTKYFKKWQNITNLKFGKIQKYK